MIQIKTEYSNDGLVRIPLFESQNYPWFFPWELSGPNDTRIKKFNLKPISASRAACGLFSISDDHIEKFQSIDERAIRNRASTFFYNMTGDSMEPIIMKDDVLIVDRSIEQLYGRVALVHLNGEILCKKLVKVSGKIILRSFMAHTSDIEVTEEMEFKPVGAVIGIYRDFY